MVSVDTFNLLGSTLDQCVSFSCRIFKFLEKQSTDLKSQNFYYGCKFTSYLFFYHDYLKSRVMGFLYRDTVNSFVIFVLPERLKEGCKRRLRPVFY